jgi:hypothetical protein
MESVMRRLLMGILATGIVAAPARAEPSLPPELADPKLGEQIGRMAEALGRAVLELPVGEIQAAAEGREATAAERGRTVRDVGRADDPDFDQRVRTALSNSRPAFEAAHKALVAALPKMLESVGAAREQLERAATNLPRPDYPKR